MDLNRRGSVKSAMIKSFFSDSPNSSLKKTASCQKTFKSSKKVVTSSGSKIAVFESESEGLVTSETVGDETTTESEFSAAERYCELEDDEGVDNMEKLMSDEMERLMSASMQSMLKSAEDEDAEDAEDEEDEEEREEGERGRANACLFGICPEDVLCQCMDDCNIEMDRLQGKHADEIADERLEVQRK